MKTCAKCKLELSLDQFAVNKSKYDGKSDKCKPCKKAYNIEYYKRTKELHNPGRAVRREAMRKAAKDFIWEVKRTNSCMDCERFYHPMVMEFDHLFDKIADIATMMSNGKSRNSLVDEISKCELVCANCHRLRTALRAGIITEEERNQALLAQRKST